MLVHCQYFRKNEVTCAKSSVIGAHCDNVQIVNAVGIWILHQHNTVKKGQIRVWQLYDYCLWAKDSSFLKDRLNRECYVCVIPRKTPGTEEIFSSRYYFLDKYILRSGCKLLYSKCFKKKKKKNSFPEEFLSISKERVDSGRLKNVSPFLPCERTLPRKWENPLPRHHV